MIKTYKNQSSFCSGGVSPLSNLMIKTNLHFVVVLTCNFAFYLNHRSIKINRSVWPNMDSFEKISCGQTWPKMSHKLTRVVRPPAMSLDELKAYLVSQHPELAEDPKHRPHAVHDCVEVFGQSGAIQSGFRKYGMSAAAFDYRVLAVSFKNSWEGQGKK